MHEGYCSLIRWVAEHDWETMSFPQPELPAEHAEAVMRWNATQSTVSEQTLHGLFLSSLETPQTAERIAVIETEGERHFTYAAGTGQQYAGACAIAAYQGRKGAYYRYSAGERVCAGRLNPWDHEKRRRLFAVAHRMAMGAHTRHSAASPVRYLAALCSAVS